MEGKFRGEETCKMKIHYMETMNPRKVCATAKYLRLPVEYVHAQSWSTFSDGDDHASRNGEKQ